MPPISVFISAIKANGLCLEAHENYQKKSLRNRFFIASQNGKFQFSIPLKRGKSNQTIITEVNIAYEEKWRHQFKHMMMTNYGSGAYYEHYIEELYNIFEKRYKTLWLLNNHLLEWVIKIGQIDITVEYTDQYKKQIELPTIDNRSLPLSHYYPLLSNNLPEYDQIFMIEQGFILNLSILDLIMNRGPETGVLLKSWSETSS
ncbi:MAG: WbqC family protein [Saprospiraceae bacterium]